MSENECLRVDGRNREKSLIGFQHGLSWASNMGFLGLPT